MFVGSFWKMTFHFPSWGSISLGSMFVFFGVRTVHGNFIIQPNQLEGEKKQGWFFSLVNRKSRTPGSADRTEKQELCTPPKINEYPLKRDYFQ